MMDDQLERRGWHDPRSLALVAMAMLVIGLLAHAVLDTEAARDLAVEDGPLEWGQAVLFLLGGVLWLAAMRRGGGQDRRRTIFRLLLAAMMFLFFLEEVSWGQRLLGWETPSFLGEHNVQGETNLHNLGLSGSQVVTFILLGAVISGLGVLGPVLASTTERFRDGFPFRGFPVLDPSLVPCFIVPLLVFYSSEPLAYSVLVLVGGWVPSVTLLSGVGKGLFSKVASPHLAFCIVGSVGTVVALVNLLGPDRALDHNVGFEIREVAIALALLYYPLFHHK